MLAARLLMGVAEGAALTPAYAVAAEEASAHRRGVNLGITQSAISLIGVAITPVVVTLLGSAFGWRWGFALAALPGLVVAALLWRFLREPQTRLHEERASLLSVFRYRNIWLSVVNGFLFGAWTVCLYGFLPLYLTGPAYRLSLTGMGAVLGAAGLVAFVGQIVVPFISDRIGRKPMVIVASLLVAGVAWAAPLGLPFPLMATAFLIFNLGQGGIPIATAVILTETAPRAEAATAVGVTIFAVEIAGFVSGIVAGALSDVTHNPALPLVIAGGAAAGVTAISFLYRETAPTRVPTAPLESEPAPARA
jgi:MFS family permease